MDDVGRHWRRDLPGQPVSTGNEGNFRNLQVERDRPQGHYPDVAISSSERFQAMKADDSISNERFNSKCRPNNDVGIHSGQFSWRMLPVHYANTASFRHKQGASHYSGSTLARSSILEIFLLFREMFSVRIEDLIEMHDRKRDFNCFEYKMGKFPCHSVLICWKFEYKQS